MKSQFKFEEVNTLDVEKAKSYYNQIKVKIYVIVIIVETIFKKSKRLILPFYRHSSHNREFLNVNWQDSVG